MDIQCNECKEYLDVAPENVKDGDIEYFFFRCPKCGAVYPISASDSALRKDIERYAQMRMIIKTARVTEEYIREASELKQRNIERSHELMGKYPLVFS